LNSASLPETDTSVFSSTPIENFAAKLFKSLNYKSEEGIGRGNSGQLKEVVQYKPRPDNLGLGAVPKKEVIDKIKNGEIIQKREDPHASYLIIGDNAQVRIGEMVAVRKGVFKGLQGCLLGIDEDKKAATIEFVINKSKAEVPIRYVVLPTSKKLKVEDLSKKKQQSNNQKLAWLLPNIRVRCVSKTYKGGLLYLKKGTVMDILPDNSFIIMTEDGKLIEDLKEDDLETIVPKKQGERVIIVKGPSRGAFGRIYHVQKNSKKIQISVEGDGDEGQILELKRGYICMVG